MKKSIPVQEHFVPETLFIYGTRRADGTPNFGLFCWSSHYFDKEMGFIACFGGDKLTRDCIKANKVFSANLVTEELLPAADYFGNTSGSNVNKKAVPLKIDKGQVLDVPILTKSPLIYELEVVRTIDLNDGEVAFCKIRNLLADEQMCDDSISLEQRMKSIRPVQAVRQDYFVWKGAAAGTWCEPMKKLSLEERGIAMDKTTMELKSIVEKFADSGWDLIEGPSKNWLAAPESEEATAELVKAVKQADKECGSCGCEFDPMYSRVLEILKQG